MPRKLITAILLAAAALALGACAPKTLPARPPNPTKAPERQSITLIRYECDSGMTVTASYPTREDTVVQYRGETHPMRIERSADGARYVGDGLEWWTRGIGPDAEGTLYPHQPNGDTGDALENCRQARN